MIKTKKIIKKEQKNVSKNFIQSLSVFKGLGVSGIKIGKTSIKLGGGKK